MSYLVLSNGAVFEGRRIGANGDSIGELVFTTGVVGYLETLTDPSYAGQIVMQTFPLIGNYGVIEEDFEGVCAVKGYVVRELCDTPSNFRAEYALDRFLKDRGVPGICGVDTRHLTQLLRDNGTLAASIVPWQPQVAPVGCDLNLAAVVSCKEPIHYGKGAKRVVLVDCGVKHQILHCLLERGIEVLRVPWDTDVNNIDADGIMISNGPGDPSACVPAIESIKKAMEGTRPIFGICLGNQIMSIAAGASTYKMTYGHRSHN